MKNNWKRIYTKGYFWDRIEDYANIEKTSISKFWLSQLHCPHKTKDVVYHPKIGKVRLIKIRL